MIGGKSPKSKRRIRPSTPFFPKKNPRIYAAIHSKSNLTLREYFRPEETATILRIPDALRELKQTFGERIGIRVLEVGSASGRLTKHIIRTQGISPENYIIGDLDYTGKKGGPFLVREVHDWVRKGSMKRFHVNVLKAPPKGLGGFHLIIVPNVLGIFTFDLNKQALRNLCRSYGKHLEKGGLIILNRVSPHNFESLKPALPRLGFEAEYSYNKEMNFCVLKLKKIGKNA